MSDVISFLVLDYKKEVETRKCLESIREHALIPHKIIYLDNGSNDDYVWDFYKQGLVDVLISKKRGYGGGVGQTDLFRFCDTKYAFFVQSDQVLNYDINEQVRDTLLALFDKGVKCIDMNGDQSNRRVWTDRAHLIDVGFFNSLAPFPNGGPGEWHDRRWNENYLQEVFTKNNYPIAHIKPVFFGDNGVWTVRALPDSSIIKMKTDTKEVHWLSQPKEKYIFPEMTDDEWALAIAGNWVNGTIPEKYKPHSFVHWKE